MVDVAVDANAKNAVDVDGMGETDLTPVGGVVHRIPDAVLGTGVRDVVTIPATSRCPYRPWWKRVDPYWNDGLFDSHIAWSTMFKAEGMYKSAGTTTIYLDSANSPATHLGRSLNLPDDTDDLAYLYSLVSILFATGIASTEHLQALTGADPAFIRGELLASGLVEYSWHHFPGRPYPRLQMWRLRNKSDHWKQFAAHCVLNGLVDELFPASHPLSSLGAGRSHARHQTLAIELALRAMEIGQRWVGWLPELFCVPTAFCPINHIGRENKTTKMRADACLVRIDGVRVFIEIQANMNAGNTEEKIRRWANLLDEGAFSGLVLFVAAGRDLLGSTVAQGIKQMIVEHVSPHAARSILVGWWPDYAPDIGQVASTAGSLRAARRVGEEWEECDADTVPADRVEGDWHLLSSLNSLASSPSWATQ